MAFVVISLLLASVVLILANDILFNKKRNKFLKILEFIGCIIIIVYIFTSMSNYIAMKNNLTQRIITNGILGTEITVYTLEGEKIENVSIGSLLYGAFVREAFNGSTGISSIEFLKNNLVIIIATIILIIYWITLLLLFEREDVTYCKVIEDEKIFEKYNPMLAACIAQNRNVMCRDLVGVVLNLINRGKINIRIIPDENSKVSGYKYMISENPESTVKLDIIEQEIYDWIFEELDNYKKGRADVDYFSKSEEGIIEINLTKRLKEISENDDTYPKLKILNSNVKKRLNNMGANKESTPFIIKAFNNALIIISIILVTSNIMKNGITLSLTNLEVLICMFIAVFVVTILPIIYIISLIFLEFFRIFLKKTGQITEAYTGRKLIAKSVSIIFATIIVIIIYVSFARDFYIIYDILLLGVTCLIIFTDDYMLKHERKILNDYYNLKRIEERISEYSLMKQENVEYIKLWDKYYSYAVAFGIPMPVNKEIPIPYENDKILSPESLEGIYYVSKAYLEVMWDMEFYNKKAEINIFSIFDEL